MIKRQYAALSVAYWRLSFKKLGKNHIFFIFLFPLIISLNFIDSKKATAIFASG